MFSHLFENKGTIFWVEVVSDLAYDFCYCVEISVNRILKIWALGAVTPWLLGVGSKYCAPSSFKKSGYLVQWNCDCLLWESQTTDHHQNPKNMGPCCSDTIIIFSGYFKQLSISINRNILNQHVFWVCVGYRFFSGYVRRLIF